MLLNGLLMLPENGMYYRKWHQMPSFILVVLTHPCQSFISFYIALKGQLFIEGKLLIYFTSSYPDVSVFIIFKKNYKYSELRRGLS